MHYHARYDGPAGAKTLPEVYRTPSVAWMELHTVVIRRYRAMTTAAGGKLAPNVEGVFNVTTTSMVGREQAGALIVRDPSGQGNVTYVVTACDDPRHL